MIIYYLFMPNIFRLFIADTYLLWKYYEMKKYYNKNM